MAKDAVISARSEWEFSDRVDAAAKSHGMKRGNFVLYALERVMNEVEPPTNVKSDNHMTEDDKKRIANLRAAVYEVVKDGRPRTFEQIADAIGAGKNSIPSISARLRDFRKPEYGGYVIDKKQIRPGLFAYWMEVPKCVS